MFLKLTKLEISLWLNLIILKKTLRTNPKKTTKQTNNQKRQMKQKTQKILYPADPSRGKGGLLFKVLFNTSRNVFIFPNKPNITFPREREVGYVL